LKITIPRNEIKFNPTSYVDPNARVFEWEGEIFRAVSLEKEEFYRRLFESNFFHKLQEKNLIVKTELTNFSLEGFSFVVKQERVPFLSYALEWPAVMLKEAAVLTLNLCLELAGQNLSLQDAYPWNIYFNYTEPVFIDVGSIIPAPQDLLWTPYQQFCQFFLYPLYLASVMLYPMARLSFFNYLEGMTEENFVKLLPFQYKIRPRVFFKIVLPYMLEKLFPEAPKKLQNLLAPLTKEIAEKTDFSKLRQKFFHQLRAEVEKIKIPIQKSAWYKYYGKDFDYSLKPSPSWNQKQRVVNEVLDEIKPKTVLDIACNRGWYSMLAASRGCGVVAFDKDEDCVSQLFFDAKDKGLKVLPLVMDVLNPTPSFGWNASQFPSALERFKCDMVFAFALVHHLVFKQLQNFDRIIETFSHFTNRWLLIEFPLPEDEKVKLMWVDRCRWYNLENFTASLNARFEIKKTFDSFPATRKLFLCEKR